MSTAPSGHEAAGSGHVFVSYSRRDLEWVRRLVTDLEAAGLPMWLDVHRLKPGVVWDTEIELALRGTDILLVVLSAHSAESRNVLDEINYALSRNRLVVPVLYGACEVPYRLARLQHVDFTGSYEPAIRALIEQLRAAGDQEHRAPHEAVPNAAPSSSTAGTEAPQSRPSRPEPPLARAGSSTFSVRRLPAAALAAAAACLLLVAGLWMFRGRGESAVPQTTTLPQAAALQPLPAPADAASAEVERRPPAASPGPAAASPSSRPSLDEVEPRQTPAPPAVTRGTAVTRPAVTIEPSTAPRRNAVAQPVTPPPAAASRVLEAPPPVTPAAETAALPPPAAVTAPVPERQNAPGPASPAVSPLPLPAAAEVARSVEPSAPVRNTPPLVDEEALIRGVVAQYARALTEKNISLLTRLRPGLPRSEAEALVKGMPAAHTVSFGDLAVKVDDDRASVRLTRHDKLGDEDKLLQTVLTMTLHRQGKGWVIERIERAR